MLFFILPVGETTNVREVAMLQPFTRKDLMIRCVGPERRKKYYVFP